MSQRCAYVADSQIPGLWARLWAPTRREVAAVQMIDVYATAGVFHDKQQLARDLAATGMLIDKVHYAVMGS